MKEPLSVDKKIYQRPMCNYFSIGVESRIGLGFDKRRTGNVCCNKFFYFTEGLKKMFGCCCLTKT
jgi:diacylglycerol kinase (ATP)